MGSDRPIRVEFIDVIAVVVGALFAALFLDPLGDLYSVVALIGLATAYLSFRLSRGWPLLLRALCVGITFLVPVVGLPLVLILARRRSRQEGADSVL